MTILVTGATGYVGSAVARELVEQGRKIRCLVRQDSNLENIKDLDVELVYGDIRDMGSLHRALKGCERVFHLAALYANWLRNPGIMYQVNEEGTRNMMAACLQAGIRKVVYCSSVAALGAHGKESADETAVFNLNATRDHYYISKFRAETVALRYAQAGLPLVVVNPTNPIGPRDQGPTPTGALILNIIKRKLPAYVDGGINLIDMSDCAQGIVAAMEKGRPGEKYILGNLNVSIKEYFDLIVRVAGRGLSPAIRMPKWMAVLSGYGYQSLAWFTGKPPITSASWVRVGSHYSWWNCSKARGELGLKQTPLEESLGKALDWFHRHHYV